MVKSNKKTRNKKTRNNKHKNIPRIHHTRKYLLPKGMLTQIKSNIHNIGFENTSDNAIKKQVLDSIIKTFGSYLKSHKQYQKLATKWTNADKERIINSLFKNYIKTSKVLEKDKDNLKKHIKHKTRYNKSNKSKGRAKGLELPDELIKYVRDNLNPRTYVDLEEDDIFPKVVRDTNIYVHKWLRDNPDSPYGTTWQNWSKGENKRVIQIMLDKIVVPITTEAIKMQIHLRRAAAARARRGRSNEGRSSRGSNNSSRDIPSDDNDDSDATDMDSDTSEDDAVTWNNWLRRQQTDMQAAGVKKNKRQNKRQNKQQNKTNKQKKSSHSSPHSLPHSLPHKSKLSMNPYSLNNLIDSINKTGTHKQSHVKNTNISDLFSIENLQKLTEALDLPHSHNKHHTRRLSSCNTRRTGKPHCKQHIKIIKPHDSNNNSMAIIKTQVCKSSSPNHKYIHFDNNYKHHHTHSHMDFLNLMDLFNEPKHSRSHYNNRCSNRCSRNDIGSLFSRLHY